MPKLRAENGPAGLNLDLAGLAALMKAAEAAIAAGRGRLKLGFGGITVSGCTASFASVTLQSRKSGTVNNFESMLIANKTASDDELII